MFREILLWDSFWFYVSSPSNNFKFQSNNSLLINFSPPDKEWEQIRAEKAKVRKRFGGLLNKLCEKDNEAYNTDSNTLASKTPNLMKSLIPKNVPMSSLIVDVTDEVGPPTGLNPSGITRSTDIILNKPVQHMKEREKSSSTGNNSSTGLKRPADGSARFAPPTKKVKNDDDIRSVLAALKGGGKLEDVAGVAGAGGLLDRDLVDALKDDGLEELMADLSDDDE